MFRLMNTTLVTFVLFLVIGTVSAAGKQNLNDLNYKTYPNLTSESSAVIEWGHSAIISALDASVARFGPQTSQAALLEVECQPVLASPMNGAGRSEEEPLEVLANADNVHGNMVVMTNNGGLSGVEMAKLAKNSGAVALLVVNVDQEHSDEIYPLPSEDGFETDIPVVMISLNSANVLTSATVTPDMDPKDVVNHGMPERVRLYAGGDRPFFEDVTQEAPALYLIHNLMTEEECDSLEGQASSKVEPITKNDILQLAPDVSQAQNVERVYLWKGALKTHAQKSIDERIEQVTGFPGDHFSDFHVEKYGTDSMWGAHYDAHPTNGIMATVTVFLSDGGPAMVFPSAKGKPVKVFPRKGLAIVHHDLDEKHQLDYSTVHAFLQGEEEGYIARKHVLLTPITPARRVVLPILALPFGGKLPSFLIQVHDIVYEKFGEENGSAYFDKILVGVCVLILLSIAQGIANVVQQQMGGSGSSSSGGAKKGAAARSKKSDPKAKRSKKAKSS
mmetsp:Transcript_9917/g.15272  ORF Transcript_9917/g.15272 Transcript_9917/m.15272 type:complete len:503 (+) Transcript_9917:170-1678(+)|eukprot:CAMPEP_0195292022 /NCGR_PEP_ID=MMETSP0707-20130614/8568_1 /TAXON_ID=33640 /ORGANISM="Asterionellopsis glacialis, Strain CCMP134" /LENGTH=502 /DNA_ID=CAMNT_0040352399 /DNA_START=79 /DNA_END=1587 /DNA_ORIENTATION=-